MAGRFDGDLEFSDGESTTTLRSTGGGNTLVALFSQPGFETIPEPCLPSLGGEAALLESVAITLSRAFDLVDGDGGGNLSWDEVLAEIPGITQQHVAAIDANGDGLLVQGELDTFIPAGEGEGEEPIPGCPLDGNRMAKHISDAFGEILLFGLSFIVLLIRGWRKAL